MYKRTCALGLCLLLTLLLCGCANTPEAPPSAGTLPSLAEDLPDLPTPTPDGSAPNGTAASAPDPGRDTAEPSAAPQPGAPKPTLPESGTTGPRETVPPTEPRDESPEDIPTEPSPASPLEPLLTEALSGLDGTWSVYAKNLDTGETVCIRDEPMVAASLIKLYVAGAYYETDPTAENSTWCAKADAMISVSSNDACNALIGRLGIDAVNRFIRACGDTQSVLNRRMLETSDRENYVTARACGQILERIVNGTYVSRAASDRLLQNLKDQERTGKIPAGVPDGIETANKTGELRDTENDACIVWSPGGTYLLCILSNGQPNPAAARAEIVKLSALVYNYFTAGSSAH